MVVMNKEWTTLRREGYLHQSGAARLPTGSIRDVIPYVVFLSLHFDFSILLVIMPQEGKDNFKSDFSGSEEGSQAYFKPKGKQAFLLKSTKIFSVLFFLNALALVVLNK